MTYTLEGGRGGVRGTWKGTIFDRNLTNSETAVYLISRYVMLSTNNISKNVCRDDACWLHTEAPCSIQCSLSPLQNVWLFLHVTYYAIYATCVYFSFHPLHLESLLATYRPSGAFKQDNSLCLWIWTIKAFVCISFISFLLIPFYSPPPLQSFLYWVFFSLTQTSSCISCSIASHVTFVFFLTLVDSSTIPCSPSM